MLPRTDFAFHDMTTDTSLIIIIIILKCSLENQVFLKINEKNYFEGKIGNQVER